MKYKRGGKGKKTKVSYVRVVCDNIKYHTGREQKEVKNIKSTQMIYLPYGAEFMPFSYFCI